MVEQIDSGSLRFRGEDQFRLGGTSTIEGRITQGNVKVASLACKGIEVDTDSAADFHSLNRDGIEGAVSDWGVVSFDFL